MLLHSGGCHCGRVRFEVIAPSRLSVSECNCSICSKSGYLHLVVPKARFRLLQGEEFLTTYYVQYKRGEAFLLLGVWCQVVLCSALTPRGVQR